MSEIELQELSNQDLLDLYEDFVEWNHYEATDEFNRLRELDVSYSDVRNEVKRRMN